MVGTIPHSRIATMLRTRPPRPAQFRRQLVAMVPAGRSPHELAEPVGPRPDDPQLGAQASPHEGLGTGGRPRRAKGPPVLRAASAWDHDEDADDETSSPSLTTSDGLVNLPSLADNHHPRPRWWRDRRHNAVLGEQPNHDSHTLGLHRRPRGVAVGEDDQDRGTGTEGCSGSAAGTHIAAASTGELNLPSSAHPLNAVDGRVDREHSRASP